MWLHLIELSGWGNGSMGTMTEPSGSAGWVRDVMRGKRWRGHWAVWCLLVVGALAVLGGYEVDRHWPYRYRNVEPLLQKVFASQIEIDRYHRTYFPEPGFVAEGLTLRRNSAPDLPPVASADKLLVQGSWGDLLMLRRRVTLVEVTGMHVVIPPVGSRAHSEDFPPGSSGDFAGPTTTVGELHLIGATLDLMRDEGTRLRFPIHDLKIRDVQRGHAVKYVVDMDNAKPTGRIRASGSFGPVTPHQLGGTPLSGEFTFAPVRLDDIGKLHGTLSGEGRFSGTLDSIEAHATTVTPQFSVGKGLPAKVDGTADATVNGLNGDVVLHKVELRTGRTLVEAAGSVAGSPKVAEIDLNVANGRAEDLLGPFLKSRPPVVGAVWVKSHAHVDPGTGGAKFLHRLHMAGTFRVPAERLTNAHTESALSAFSERAQGGRETTDQATADPAADVLSSLEGSVTMQDGVLLTRRLRFELPGASADLAGTYDLRNGAAHLLGNLTMAADLSHAATGWKSVLLKPLAPFFKKKPTGTVVPIAVTGVPGSYKVGQDIFHNK
ncbi:MAG: hypothetical protein NVSMB62_17740 [Acidobacteriaceae bacterium]